MTSTMTATMSPEEMKRLRELVTERDAIRTALLELEEKEEPTDEDTETQEDLLARYEANEPELGDLQKKKDAYDAHKAERMQRLIEAGKDDKNREHSTWTGVTGGLTLSRSYRDPFEDIDSVERGLVPRTEMQARAYAAVERADKLCQFGGDGGHDRAEATVQRIQGDYRSNDIAKHVLTTGSDEYLETFQDYLQNPEGTARRAGMTLTLANGGYLLPYVLDPSIVLTNASSANPYRRISGLKSTTSNAWQGVSSAGVNAAVLAEGTAATDASPTVAQIQITPRKFAAWVFGSYEVLADTDFAQQLPTLFADARDRIEEQKFTTGNGTTEPKGIITAATSLTTTGTTLVYAMADIYKLHAALTARFRNGKSPAWIMNVAYINKTRQFDTAGGSSFWTNLGKGQPETLLGAPIYESTTMFGGVQAVGSKLAVFGDFSQFFIVDRVGVSIIYEPLLKDTATPYPTGNAGWFMFWRTGSDISTVNAFAVLSGL